MHFVHEQFRTPRSATDKRRCVLALALSQLTDSVALDALPNLSLDVARAYDNLSRLTLIRDVQALEQRHLLTYKDATVRVNRKHILAFLPWRHGKNEAE